ncbi:hypothetical protein [Galbibacter mesophilus]|uniref:hypothetical protein n=1 Tax=Galbibacter mesophilus TaxID=379069 RepID=UPI00191D0CBD|nr:hypothetical protein [Galbibacter mesophilus]MCM5663194.1 hypothetical protein [Galbibacter mesophilus]
MEKLSLYVISVVFGVLIYLLEKQIRYPLNVKLSKISLSSESILSYKFKSIFHYNNFLEKLQGSISKLDTSNSKMLLSEAIELTTDSKPSFHLKIYKWTWSEILIVIYLISIPLLDRIHLIAPEEKIWNIGDWVISSGYFSSVVMYLWVLFNLYGTTFISLNIWFLSSKYWWKYFLLIPIVLHLYQLWNIVGKERYFHENEIFNSFPVLIMLVSFLILISLKWKNYHRIEQIKERIRLLSFEIVHELSEKEKDNSYKNVEEEIQNLLANKASYKPEEYLMKLEFYYQKLYSTKK